MTSQERRTRPSGGEVASGNPVRGSPVELHARSREPVVFARVMAGKRGLPELLDFGRLLSGHLFNQLLDGGGWRLADLNELHAAHNSAGGGPGKSHDGRNSPGVN